MVLATDEVYTYAIFNYAEINWSSHTEAGGDTTGGEGGVPAYVSFKCTVNLHFYILHITPFILHILKILQIRHIAHCTHFTTITHSTHYTFSTLHILHITQFTFYTF